MPEMTLIAATKKYLGLPGESLSDFSAQYKRLTDADRDDLKAAFSAIGVTIVEKK